MIKFKTVASMALLVSSVNAHAIMAIEDAAADLSITPVEKQERTYCLETYYSKKTGLTVSDCDMSLDNKINGEKLGKNGCAKGQVAMTTIDVKIMSCPVANQL